MNAELLLAVERMLKVFAASLKYAKPVTSDLVEIWAAVLSRKAATPEEVESLTTVIMAKTNEFPSPADGLEWIETVRNEAIRLQLKDMRRAQLDDVHNCLTTPDQVRDGVVVARGAGNGVPLDELAQMREARGLPGRGNRTLNVRQLLKALPRNAPATMSEEEVRDRDEQIARLRGGK